MREKEDDGERLKERMNGYHSECIIQQHTFTTWLPLDLTRANVRPSDKQGDDNANETDCVMKRDLNGE